MGINGLLVVSQWHIRIGVELKAGRRRCTSWFLIDFLLIGCILKLGVCIQHIVDTQCIQHIVDTRVRRIQHIVDM